jgi:hypothetical protein
VLSPFWIWPPDRRTLASFGLGAIATIVVSASLLAGAVALARDLRTAYLWAGPSIIRESDRRQIDAVRESLADGEGIFVFAGPDEVWYARVWQRGLYPRNPAIVQIGGVSESPQSLRNRYGVRRAVILGAPPPFSPPLRAGRDLGPLQGRPGRVTFGELP